jgi:DNA-binding transcriptional regulator PaaX
MEKIPKNKKREFKYKGMSVNIFGLQSFGGITKKKIPTLKRDYLRSFTFTNPTDAPKNLLLIYDIPEVMKKERDWFRRQLKNFNFVMIQRSAWIGPSPLPKDFTDYVERIGLKKQCKTFKLAKAFNLAS